MKHVLLTFGLSLVFRMGIPHAATQPDTVVRLLQLLVEKGIITEEEAVEVVREADEKEDHPTNGNTHVAEVKPVAAAAEKESRPLESRFISVKNTLRFSGDLRLRYDSQRRDLGGDLGWDRRRPRFRLRFGFAAEPTDNTEVGVRLASGAGLQNTTNQSFGEHSRGKPIFIDRVYGSWEPTRWLKVTGGKHKNPFFTSPLVWDEDVNLEGASEELNYRGENVQLFSKLTQFVIGELDLKAKSNHDPIMFGFQSGFSAKPARATRIEVTSSYYDYRHLSLLSPVGIGNSATFVGYNQAHGQQMVFDSKGNLLNKFGCFELGTVLRFTDLSAQPLSFFGHYIKNVKADVQRLRRDGMPVAGTDPAALGAYGSDNRDHGFQFGAEFGYRQKKGDLNLQYFYQALQDYAFPAVFVDSDFHGGGTNNRGHRARVNYFLTDNIYLQGVFFFTKRDSEAKDGKQDENRTQLDVVFNF